MSICLKFFIIFQLNLITTSKVIYVYIMHIYQLKFISILRVNHNNIVEY